jgi:membrane protease YdiL (CAAX protease family)
MGGMNQRGMQRRLTAWWVLIGVLTLLNFSAYFSDGDTPNDVLYRYEAAIFGFLFYMLILGVVLFIGAGLDRREAFALRRPRSWGAALGLAVILVFTMLVVAAALEPVLHAGEAQGLDPPGWDASRAPALVLNAIVVAVVGPIVEELTFRGIGFFLLAQFGQVAAVLVTAVAFALTHGILEGLPVFFIIGVALAFIRARTDSIYPPIVMHAGFNAIGVIAGIFN